MRPVTQTFSHSVPAPIEQVFALLTDPGRIPDWLPGCSEVQSDGPLHQGSRLNVRFGERATEFEVVDFARPGAFSWAERGEREGWWMFVRLAVLGDSTTVTVRDAWLPRSRGGWLHARLWDRRRVRRHLKQIVQRVRSAVTRDGRIWGG